MRTIQILIILAFSITNCDQEKDNDNEASKKQLNNSFSQQDSKSADASPSVIKINPDSLTVITPGENGVPVPKVVRAGKPNIIQFPGIRSVKAGSPNIVKVPEKLVIITPGENSVPFPKKYDIPDSSWNIQHGDTIYAPQAKIYPHPRPRQALSPRFKDIATNNIQCLDVNQGLPPSSIWSILEDKYGNIWFATWGNGVCKYDGTSFFHYTKKEGLSNNVVLSMLEDKTGNLWFGTFGGVSKYDGKSFIHYGKKEGLENIRIWTMLEDVEGNLWFGSRVGGLSKYDGKSFIHYTEKEGLINNSIQAILQDTEENLWFGTGNGLSKYDGKSFIHYSEKEGLCNKNVFSMLEDKDGNLWFGTENGLSIYDGKSFINYSYIGILNYVVHSILQDKDSNIWVGSAGGGVIKYDGVTFTNYSEKEGLIENRIISMLEDKNGNLWFGTESGVSKLVKNSFSHYNEIEGFWQNRIRSIQEDRNGNIWFGSWLGSKYEGVIKFDGESFFHYSDKEGLSGNWIVSIFEDKAGNLWFSTLGGVSKFDGKNFTNYTGKEGLCHNYVYSILEDKSGNLWFATYGGGVNKFDGKSFIHYSENEGLCNNFVLSMLEDKDGNLWFGTEVGLSRFDGLTFTNYGEKEGFNFDFIWSMLEDKDKNLWFTTEGSGVYKYDRMSFTCYSEKDGLGSNFVRSILEDNNGNLWFGTDRGLTYFNFFSDLSEYKKGLENNNKKTKPVIYNFNEQDGLKELVCNQNTAFLDSKNHMWWGIAKTLTMLDLNEFEFSTEPPRIQMNTIEIKQNFIDYRRIKDTVYQKTLPFGEDLSGNYTDVAMFYNYPINPNLPYHLNHLTFYFSAIDWAAPHQIKYQYILDGLDKTWNSLTEENKADYRNIPPGKYTFKVKSIGIAKTWSNTFEYAFIIYPPWWKTTIAYISYIILIFLLIYGFVKWRTWRLRHEKEMLEKEVEERTHQLKEHEEELFQQKEELQQTLDYLKETQAQLVQSEKMASIGQLTAGIAHEINNPVNYINAGIDSLSTNLAEIDQVLDMYQEITPDNSGEKLIKIKEAKEQIEYDQARGEIKQLVESIKKGSDRTTEIVKGLRTFSRLDENELKKADLQEGIDLTLMMLQNKYKHHVQIVKEYGKIPFIECYPGKLNQVFMNILSNAIDAIQEKGVITIKTFKHPENGMICISIKDTGEGISDYDKTKIFDPFFTTKDVGKGTGLGLSISHGIIEQHKGLIEVESSPGEGTNFVISLPERQRV